MKHKRGTTVRDKLRNQVKWMKVCDIAAIELFWNLILDTIGHHRGYYNNIVILITILVMMTIGTVERQYNNGKVVLL